MILCNIASSPHFHGFHTHASYDDLFPVFYKKISMHSYNCEIEDVAETFLCKLCVTPRSRVFLLLQLRAESKRIDTLLTTTSMKLAEEKINLRKKEHIRARLKEYATFDSVEQDLNTLKVSHAREHVCCGLRWGGTLGFVKKDSNNLLVELN